MQIDSRSLYSPYAIKPNTVQRNTTQLQSVSSSASGNGTSSGVSSYDFTNMSPAKMQDTMNDLIKIGKMSLDDSSSLVGMIPTALSWAGSGTPSSASLDQARSQHVDFLETLSAGITGAKSRGDTQNAESLTRTLNVLQDLQGTPSAVDIRV